MAIDPQSCAFWQQALRSELLTEADLQACWERIPEEKRTPDAIDRRLAREAVNGKKLTLWQAQQVLAGRAMALRFAKYILIDVIGQGGMGRVYLAQDVRLRRKVAIKVLSRERMSNPRALARFTREAKVGAQLQHDNLVRIYDEGEARGNCYLVMEYIEGENVAQMLAESERLPADVVARIGRQVALGLEHARLKGLIHRDINPQNILVTVDGIAKLTDMGLAIDLADQDDIVTRDGATVGTFDYISPEQARHPRDVDTRSDIYSLGCTFYHMLVGRVPFVTASLPEKLYAHQLEAPQPLTELVPEIPEGLEAIVLKMMAKQPEERFATPLEIAKALEPYAGGEAPFSNLVHAPVARATNTATASAGRGGLPFSDSTEPEGLRLPIDLGPESSISDSITESRSRSKSWTRPPSGAEIAANHTDDALPDASERQNGAPKTESDAATPSASESSAPDARTAAVSRRRWLSKRVARLGGALALTLGLVALALALDLPRRVSRGIAGIRPAYVSNEGRSENSPSTDSGGAGQTGAELKAETGGSDDSGGPPLFSVLRRAEPLEVTPYSDLQRALYRAASDSRVVLIGESEEPIHISSTAFHVPDASIEIRPYPNTKPTLVIHLDGAEPFLRQNRGTLTVSDLTFLVHYSGELPEGRERPPLIEAHARLELRRCALVEERHRGPLTRAIRAEGLATTITGCLFQGFDRPLDLRLMPNSQHELRQSILVWPQGRSVDVGGWVARLATGVAARRGARTLTIDHCTVLRAAGLIEAEASEAFLEDRPTTVRVQHSAIRADHLLCVCGPDMEALPFPRDLIWHGSENRYAFQKTWVVSSLDGLSAPEGAATDMNSWVESLGPESADDSRPTLVELGNESALTSRAISAAQYALKLETDESIGADPQFVGPFASPAPPR